MNVQPIEISKNFFMLRSPEEGFHRNLFYKKFVGAEGIVNMLFDPGTKQDIVAISEGFGPLMGQPENIDFIFLSHQDPDVSSNVSMLMDCAPDSLLLASVDTWRLVNMYGLPEGRFYPLEKIIDRSRSVKLKATGHILRIIPARFCHFRGSMMLYDKESRTLFSGDFLGGVNTRKGDGPFATEESWEGISLFHQLYMPSSKALHQTIDLISSLNPLPEVIAPQHGDIITGELVYKFLGRLSNLTVGIDYLIDENNIKQNAITAINTFLEFVLRCHRNEYSRLLNRIHDLKDFTKSMTIAHGEVSDLKVSFTVAFQQLYSLLDSEELESAPLLKDVFLKIVDEADLVFTPQETSAQSVSELI